jgi:predicted RNase H-like nuclease (RuvC/YqgF family)
VEVRDGVLDEFPGPYAEWAARQAGGGGAGEAGARLTDGAADAPDARSGEAAPQPTKAERMAARKRARDVSRRLERARRRLASLEDEIGEAEGRVETLGHRMADPEVYRDGDAVRELATERAATQETVDGLYREWERVAAEIESLEQAPA